MSKKGENIYRRKDGRWEARYVKSRELSGKIIYGFCYGKTYKEAKEKVEQARANLLNNIPPLSNPKKKGQRFVHVCEAWLALQRGVVKTSSYVKYETNVRRHILPHLGSYYPSGINTKLAEQFKLELLDEGLAPKTVRDILVTLRMILKYMVSRMPGPLPPIDIVYPKEGKRTARVLSVDEQIRFVNCLYADMDECKFGILLALQTGLRLGELCALRWGNISLRDRTIQVEATMQRIRVLDGEGDSRTKICIGTPKTETSIRTIPMSEKVAGLCREIHPRSPAAFVLTGTVRYMEPRTLQRRLEKYTKECGLEGVHFHTLRHSFATRCVEVGFELKSLSEVLGHSSTSITLDRYVHASLDMKRKNMDKLSAAGF